MTRPITSIRDGRSASHAADVAPEGAGQPTDPAGPTGRLSSWLANTTLDDVPAPVGERAEEGKSQQDIYDEITTLYPDWVSHQSWLMFNFPALQSSDR